MAKKLSLGKFFKEDALPMQKQNELKKEADLNVSAFLLCPPFNLSSDNPNNIWMKEMDPKDRKIDIDKAFSQWFDFYSFLASSSMVYLIPAVPGLQDQSYVANLGLVLPHRKTSDVVISNFTSEVRINEAPEGLDFFKKLGYNVYQAPDKFEGEADLKYIKDNVYVGGYGIRSKKETYEWFEKEFDMKIIKVKMTDERLYHFDCMFLPVNTDSIIACTDLIDKPTLREIEKYAEVYPVSKEVCESGITNSVITYQTICTHSDIDDLKATDENYPYEREKVDTLNKIAEKIGFEPIYFNISEYTKSGALMSCLVMHVTFRDFKYPQY